MFNKAPDSPQYHPREISKISVNDLQIGMYVSKLDRPWLETNFWFQGFEIRTQAEITALKQQCDHVFIETLSRAKIAEPLHKPNASPKPYYLHSIQQESNRAALKKQINQAEILHRHTSQVVKSFMEAARFGRPLNTVVAQKTVVQCVDTLLAAPDTLMLMTHLKQKDEYTAQHSMNVCLFAIALGKQLDMHRHALHNLGLCGMLHDMGKMTIPTEILTKPARLTSHETEIMQSHAQEGGKMLAFTNGIHQDAVDVAHMHHERLDGVGYPRRLRAAQITPYSQLVAIVDVYDAMTSDRVYQAGIPHLDAIKILLESAHNGHLNLHYTMKFIECLGVYPVGCLVELVNGEEALVLETNPNAQLKPKIIILKNADKQACQEVIIDLAMLTENQYSQYAITKILPNNEGVLNLCKYYDCGLVSGFEYC